MDENHLEPIVETPESACGGLCDKIMKNMVLTLTILGKFIVPLVPPSHPQSINCNSKIQEALLSFHSMHRHTVQWTEMFFSYAHSVSQKHPSLGRKLSLYNKIIK